MTVFDCFCLGESVKAQVLSVLDNTERNGLILTESFIFRHEDKSGIRGWPYRENMELRLRPAEG